MTEATKAVLKIAEATDKQVSDAEALFDKFLKDFFSAKPQRKKGGLNQSICARIALEWIDEVSGDAIPLAVGLYACANASQLRQYCENEKRGYIEKSLSAWE